MKYPSGKVVTKQDRIEAKGRLADWLKDGDTLWFILRHRSASGMSRVYDVKLIEIEDVDIAGTVHRARVSTLSWSIAEACNLAWSENHGGVKVNGCGFSGEDEITQAVAQTLGIKLRYETL